MKFGKRLKKQIEETLPEWQDKFVSYKELKKLVRLISGTAQPSSGIYEAHFIHLLDAEIDKINAFFVEQEEDFIICQKLLQERIQNVTATSGIRPSQVDYAAEMGRITRDIVDFHGEMVLLVNYSSINYTGLAKILKKYDKRTGRLLRLPFIEKVLKQPFFTTDLISKLVKECEATMDVLLSVAREQRPRGKRDTTPPVRVAEQSIFRNTVAALATMQEMSKGSSTYGHFSIPPLSLQQPDVDLLQPLQLPYPIPIQ